MTESYLHLLWRTKRLPLHLLKTIEEKSIRIIHMGVYNTTSGPDFFNGKMELDGIIHSGNIEMHIKSSDWYAHGHQFDEAYNNVILHVVYEHDKLVFIEGVPIPTLELKQFIDEQHFQKTIAFTAAVAAIPCANLLSDCPAPVFWNQVEHALWQRLERKSAGITHLAQQVKNDPKQVFFHAAASAFGMKTNQLPFQELAHRLPFERLLKASRIQVESMVFGTSGLLETGIPDHFQKEMNLEWNIQRSRYAIYPAHPQAWKFKGCRPAGFPTLRLAQFSAFVHRMDWSEEFWELRSEEMLEHLMASLTAKPSDYWMNHYHFGKEKARPKAAMMSISTAHVVLINSVAPFLWWLADLTGQSVYREKAVELLELVAPESNVILDQWNQKKVKPKSAAESQGLLELKNEFCNRKQCLNCKVGLQLLKR